MFYRIFKKELLLLLRSPTALVSFLALSISFVFLFYNGWEKPIPLSERGVRSLKWGILFLLNFILIGQSLWEERESGAWEVQLSRVSISTLYFAKTLVIWVLGIFLSFFVLLLHFVFFQNAVGVQFFWQMGFLAAGSLGLVALGVALGILSMETRTKEILLPLLQIPFSIPLFLLAREAEERFFLHQSIQGFFLLVSVGAVYWSLSALLLEILQKGE